jgi:exonuclease III
MKELKIITYNVDGLPERLDLKDLPWILKPISWIYKLIKKTTLINVNDNIDSSSKTKQISKYFSELNPDIIVVQEDFNYHSELMEYLPEYKSGSYLGGFDLSKIFKSIKWFPYPRFKSDGLNLMVKNGKILNERIIKWNKSYGYFSHANDELTTKGFRYYDSLIDKEIRLNVYVIHMDADFYNSETCPNITKDLEARKHQFKQLVDQIKNNYLEGDLSPTIIIGDTNSYNKYEWDVQNIQENLVQEINLIPHLFINECVPNYNDCDRIFFINHSDNNFKLEVKNCYFDTDVNLSDHKPLITTFNIVQHS